MKPPGTCVTKYVLPVIFLLVLPKSRYKPTGQQIYYHIFTINTYFVKHLPSGMNEQVSENQEAICSFGVILQGYGLLLSGSLETSNNTKQYEYTHQNTGCSIDV